VEVAICYFEKMIRSYSFHIKIKELIEHIHNSYKIIQ
jgi:hypothetical protein